MRSAWRAILAMLVLAGAVLGLGVGPAAAENGDVITDYRITYDIQRDGSVRVTEDIDYQFDQTGRHGIFRTLLLQQRDGKDSDSDAVYKVTDVQVSSPDAPAQFTTVETKHGGERYLTVQIGDPQRTLLGDHAAYRISYGLKGALRTVNGMPELYWNATGLDWDADIRHTQVRVTAPEGVGALSCYWGKAGSTSQCQTRTEAGVGIFEQGPMSSGEGVTISAQLPVASVTNATPTLVRHRTVWDRAHVGPKTLVPAGGAALLSVLLAGWTWRRSRDKRYVGLAPGIADRSAPVAMDTLDEDQIPVQFAPPPLPPERAGQVLRRLPTSRMVAAVITDLAHAGAIDIHATARSAKSTKKGVSRVALLRDRSAATAPGRAQFLNTMLPDPSSQFPLDDPGKKVRRRFGKAAETLDKTLQTQVKTLGWVDQSSRWGKTLPIVVIMALPMAIFLLVAVLGLGALAYAIPAVIVLLAMVVIMVLSHRTRLTAEGRAIADQVVGFRRYLERAEAGQLRFEEGQDIFSAYLPWAIIFDLAERWQKVCAELAAAGQIPSQPSWYAGPSFYDTYSDKSFGESLSSSASSAVSSTSSSSSHSGSGGGGSSGGGGGGGGGGSW